jgi:sulfonate transport system substrate-binding protein
MMLRLGGVAENVNLPWYRMVEAHDLPDLELKWTVYDGGTGAMVEALDTGAVDVVVALTEGIVAAIGNGHPIKLVGSHTASGLIWGAHVAAESPWQELGEMRGARVAISRYGSGSHIMAVVEANRRGWPLSSLKFVQVGNLDGARKAFEAGEVDMFLWEKYTTKPLVDDGEWRRIGECVTPWPGFSVAARTDICLEHSDTLGAILQRVAAIGSVLTIDSDGTVEQISHRFGLKEIDVQSWLETNRWCTSAKMSSTMLADVITTLRAVEVLPESAADLQPADLVWSGCKLT